MNQPDKVSIILPAYNRGYTISRAIDSVLKQTYQNFELIIVDDGSTDETEDVVNGYTDERIIYIKHESNKGAGAARNTGIMNARAGYIAFQDSDDEWVPAKLEKQMSLFRKCSHEVGVVFCGSWLVLLDKQIYHPSAGQFMDGKNAHIQLLKDNFIGPPAAVVRRECFEKAGYFDIDLPIWEDWELFIRFSKYYQFKFINEGLCYAYFLTDSLNEASILTKANTWIKVTEKHLAEYNNHRSLLARQYKEIARLFCTIKNYKRGVAYYLKAFRVYPLNIKYLGAAFLLSIGMQSSYHRLDRFYLNKKMH